MPHLQYSSPVSSPTLGSPAQRRREDELLCLSPHLGVQKKNKMKTKISSPLVQSPRLSKKAEEDKLAKRIRESYACLRHRAMHKRCPAECPERRIPKPLPVAQERWQVQQVRQSPSPLLQGISSPNTMRVLQDFQNAHISSPQLTHRRDSYEAPPTSFASIAQKTDTSMWDQIALSSSWGPGEWADETWQDLSSNSVKWDSGESQDDSSPLNDLDSWFVDGTPGPLTGITDEDLSAVAQSIDSTEQLLQEMSHEGHHLITSSVPLLLKIIITRDQIESWMEDELFLKSLRGFYVRVRIAELNGIPVHRIGCVVESRDNCFKPSYNDTGMGIVVHFGSTGQHIVSVSSIANTPPDEAEVDDWAVDAERNHITIMPQEVAEKQSIMRILSGKGTAYSSH